MENRYINNDFPFSEITSQLIRFAYDIFDELGYGLPEKTYHKAFEKLLKDNKIGYRREKYGMIKFQGETIGRYFLDFLIEHQIALEFKVRNKLYQTDINQLLKLY